MIEAVLSFSLFLFLEAFFALSEIAYVSADKLLIERLSKRSTLANICLNFWKDPERLFTTTTLGLTLSIAGNGIFTTYFLIKHLKEIGALISATLLPLLMLIFGHILPKSIGKKLSYPLVIYLAPFIYSLSYLFYPIYFFYQKLSKVLLKEEEKRHPYFLTKFREVFSHLITYEEEIDLKEKELMHKILEFAKKKVYQIMVPLSKVKALPLSATVEDALAFSSKYNFSYIPLYEENLTNIKYLVKVQDLLGKSLLEMEKPLLSFARVPLYIPEIIPAQEALRTLQKNSQEMAIVVDEYGLATGLITVEDLVEEVLGEFWDALDYHEPEYKKLDKNTFLVKGFIEIEKLQTLGFPIPPGEYETLNGFIYHLLNRIPQRGEVITFGNLEIIIQKAQPQKVEEVLLRLKK
ncbi:MAG: hemolysin family protein [Caldimicrobium sp.]